MIAIVGILAGIIIPTMGKVRASARKATTISNLRSVHQAMNLYVANNKKFPKVSDGSFGHKLVIGGYLSSPNNEVKKNPVMGCPEQLSQFPEALEGVDLPQVPLNRTGYFTFAMNGRMGDKYPANVVRPAKTALVGNGAWDGLRFSNTMSHTLYKPAMVAPNSPPPFSNNTSVLMVFVGGNVDLVKISDIPVHTTPEGAIFWDGL